MKIQWKKLLVCLALPLAAGGLSAWISRNGYRDFQTLQKPPLSPPAWLFPVVWTALYVLMGVAAYLVWTAPRRDPNAFTAYGAQLALNFFWSILFFRLKNYTFAFVWLVLLWIAILASVRLFAKSGRLPALLMLPYLLWVSFAGYLNLGVALLN